MGLRKARNLFLSAASVFVLSNCTNELPLSELINNTMTLKVLGTYESNNPYGDLGLKTDEIFSSTYFPTTGSAPVGSLSPTITGGTNSQLYTYATGLPVSRLKYYLDIAEIRMAQGQGKSSSQTIADYWSQFAISRQLMCSDYTTAENKTLSNCADANGIQRLSDFFNGGFSYPAVDVKSGTFNHLGIYFRRFATYPAALFNGDGTYFGGTSTTAENAMTTAFDNRTIYGLDTESFLQNAYNENNSQGRMFPLERKDLTLQIQEDREPYVLEVRVFIKNLMMVHLRQITGNSAVAGDSSNGATVFVGPSDWNINHSFVDTNSGGTISGNATRMGGALLMTARTYQPAKVGSIVMTGTVGNGNDYFAVVTAGTTFPGVVGATPAAGAPTTTLPLAATQGLNRTISNLPAGSYDVYRTCDLTKCGNGSTAGYCDVVTGSTASRSPDGFPETAVKCASGVTVTASTATSVSLGNCISTNTTTNPCFITGVN